MRLKDRLSQLEDDAGEGEKTPKKAEKTQKIAVVEPPDPDLVGYRQFRDPPENGGLGWLIWRVGKFFHDPSSFDGRVRYPHYSEFKIWWEKWFFHFFTWGIMAILIVIGFGFFKCVAWYASLFSH